MGPNEDREQRLHDAKMERLAREEAEKDQLVKDGNRLADALVKSREEVLKLREQIESLGAEKDAMVLQIDGVKKIVDTYFKSRKPHADICGCWACEIRKVLLPIEKRKGGGCDCGASIPFPAHQPGCPLHSEYR
jgi:hypothetical protein